MNSFRSDSAIRSTVTAAQTKLKTGMRFSQTWPGSMRRCSGSTRRKTRASAVRNAMAIAPTTTITSTQ